MKFGRSGVAAVLTIVVIGTILLVPLALAQTVDAGGDVDKDLLTASDTMFEGGMSWKEIMKSGGWPMYLLAAMSVLALALMLYFGIVLRTGQVAPRPLHRELLEKIGAGMVDEAIKACEYHPCPLSSVMISALEHYKHNPHIDAVLLRDMVESEGERQADEIQGQTQYLLDIGVIAPMVGLLGTVLGMLQAFSGVALSSALSKPVVLAGGVSKALITTASGLVVAIPAMIAYSFFRRRAAKLVASLESATTDLLTMLIRERL